MGGGLFSLRRSLLSHSPALASSPALGRHLTNYRVPLHQTLALALTDHRSPTTHTHTHTHTHTLTFHLSLTLAPTSTPTHNLTLTLALSLTVRSWMSTRCSPSLRMAWLGSWASSCLGSVCGATTLRGSFARPSCGSCAARYMHTCIRECIHTCMHTYIPRSVARPSCGSCAARSAGP